MGRKRILTRAQVLMYLHRAGFNRARAACEAGVSRATFFNAMRRHKIKAPHPQAKISKADAELIRELADARLTRAEIADKFEVSASLVTRVVGYSRR